MELQIFATASDMPPSLYYQAETYVRLEWADEPDYDMEGGLQEAAAHVTLGRGNTLFSYASVIRTELEHGGETYRCYGLRSVFTFPASRRRGYAARVVAAATALMTNRPDADIGLLWTAPDHVGLYAGAGWREMATMTTLYGDRSAPEAHDQERAMMLFISPKGVAQATAFDGTDVHVGDEPW